MAHTSTVPACYLECVFLHACVRVCVCVSEEEMAREKESKEGVRAVLALCGDGVKVFPG